MSDLKEFLDAGSRIRTLRGKATQGEFAERLGVNRKTVERWEAGERLPDGQSLLALMTVCGADVNYILTGQRMGGAAAPTPAVSAGDRVLLENFHAAPAQVQAGIKTTLGAFADAPAQVKSRKRAA